ncbi:MAG: putative DNA binding domain-containing protein [Tannerellaceae bacterium]|jgi:predicted HTH transcriptional regulator|nr:putative DNA binding domain-containing protein [Tannerellaceae bacterium]
MNERALLDIISGGETSRVQFKRELDNQDKLAAEMIAFSNAKGGMIIFGVEDKTGTVVGLAYDTLQKTNNAVSTIANDLVKPVIYITTEVVNVDVENEKKNILIVYVDEGLYKPYKDKNGAIWMKQGSDKRRMTENAEIARLFQQNGMVYADEMIVANTTVKDIDREKVVEYIKKFRKETDEDEIIPDKLPYANLNILRNGNLTLGGLLVFSKNPQKYRPAFCIKAISFFGNSIGGDEYRDSRDITGTIPQLFSEAMSFFKANLKHVQAGQNFNSTGKLEISEIALEELLQNALLHRDYTKNAPIRLMIFDNRIEIVSPGHLPNSLTVENIKMGNAVVRNNLLVSYCAKLMKYRGFGSGIIRAMKHQPDIELINDTEGEQFIVRIPRKETYLCERGEK